MLSSIDPLFSLSGFFVGLLVGQTGMGGGSLMTPLLILLFGVHPATAVGTDLLYASATKTAGTLVHGLNHTVQWRIVGLLAAGSVPATAITLLAISQFDLSRQRGLRHDLHRARRDAAADSAVADLPPAVHGARRRPTARRASHGAPRC